jgi:hypothetical protein
LKNSTKEERMNNKILISVGMLALAVSAFAASPAYVTKSAAGNAAAPAQLTFPADPNSQVRIIQASYDTDTNNSVLSFSSGTTAYYQTITNTATTMVTNQINSTNGLTPNATLVLQHAGVCYPATVTAWNQATNFGPYMGTNIVLASGGWGVIASPGDSIYLMSSAVTIAAPAAASGTTTSATISGEALYVGQYSGRPVTVKITPAFATNKLSSVTAHYD